MTGALLVVLLGAALAASIAAAPIWRRTRPRRPAGGAPLAERLVAASSRAWRHRRASGWGPALAAVVCGGAGLAAGPVVAGVLAAYGSTGFAVVRAIAVRRSEQRAYRLAADAVVGLAADLRAGATLDQAWRAAEEALRAAQASVLPRWRAGGADVSVVADRLLAASVLSQSSGAPLADVLDRLDAHLRAVDRARSVAESQAAGARVSAALLAAMPVAGAGLGAMIGVDVFPILFHTSLGALVVGTAIVLQVGGLAWAVRLADARVVP